jgi:HEAT repeat protein
LQLNGKALDGPNLPNEFERLLDTSGPVVRTAAQVVWIFGMREARSRVIGLLKAASPATRGEALRTLEKIWHEDDFATVLALFREDPSQQVRRTAGWTLRATRTAARAKDLFELWRGDPLARHRTWACEIAAEFPGQSFLELAASLQQDPDGHVRKAARRAVEAIANAV